ncbi:hypothetical protein SLG_28730 [Sphingobium sp. SYK-6]|nr:hypothetical protein SLG_28730 [Sphingobium sp. SYK-6]
MRRLANPHAPARLRARASGAACGLWALFSGMSPRQCERTEASRAKQDGPATACRL